METDKQLKQLYEVKKEVESRPKEFRPSLLKAIKEKIKVIENNKTVKK
jgi:hypothetical protein